MTAFPQDQRSLGQLFQELIAETRTLVRQEVALAKTELTDKASFVGKNAAMIAAGGLVVLMGALPVIAGIVIALGHKIGYATASFLVGILFVVVGAVIAMKAIGAMKKTPMAPQQTVAQVKETKTWAKEQMR